MADTKVRSAEKFLELQDIGGLSLLKIVIRTTRVRIDISGAYCISQLLEVTCQKLQFAD